MFFKLINPEVSGPVFIAIHGNSSSMNAFMNNDFKYKTYLIDLPGHGRSARNKEYYSFNGFAKAVVEFMDENKIERAVILGWSLGGQVGYSMMSLYPDRVEGLIAWGAPPVPADDLMIGFHAFPEAAMMGCRRKFNRKNAAIFNKAAGLPDNKIFVKDAMITHGKARYHMIKSATTGGGVDARTLVATSNIPLIFIICEEDKGVNNDYIVNCKTRNCINVYSIFANHAGHYYRPDVINQACEEMYNHLLTFYYPNSDDDDFDMYEFLLS